MTRTFRLSECFSFRNLGLSVGQWFPAGVTHNPGVAGGAIMVNECRKEMRIKNKGPCHDIEIGWRRLAS